MGMLNTAQRRNASKAEYPSEARLQDHETGMQRSIKLFVKATETEFPSQDPRNILTRVLCGDESVNEPMTWPVQGMLHAPCS